VVSWGLAWSCLLWPLVISAFEDWLGDSGLAWGCGAGLAAVIGYGTALASRKSARTHAAARVLGALLCGVGSVLGGVFLLLSEQLAHTPQAGFLAGIGEFVIGIWCLLAALFGLFLSVAGLCAQRFLRRQSSPRSA